MRNTESFWKEIYQKLGHLFYAAAFVDGSIEVSEMEVLKKKVWERWLHIEERQDEFGSDAAFQIISVFDWLATEKTSSADAYDVFAKFCCKNREWMSVAMKENMLQTTVDISLAYGGENREEHIFITNLTALLSKHVQCANCSMKAKHNSHS